VQDNTVITRQFNRQVEELDHISEQPTLQALAYALRNPDVWPGDFTWDYRKTDHCALGLAARLWPKRIQTYGRTVLLTDVLSAFGISHMMAYLIFINARTRHWFLRNLISPQIQADTTPNDVANMIDKYLQKGETQMMLEMMGF
jgi:hypothetical protein